MQGIEYGFIEFACFAQPFRELLQQSIETIDHRVVEQPFDEYERVLQANRFGAFRSESSTAPCGTSYPMDTATLMKVPPLLVTFTAFETSSSSVDSPHPW